MERTWIYDETGGKVNSNAAFGVRVNDEGHVSHIVTQEAFKDCVWYYLAIG